MAMNRCARATRVPPGEPPIPGSFSAGWFFAAVLGFAGLLLAGTMSPAVDRAASPARYDVRMTADGTGRISVHATLPIDGARLAMDDTRPAILDGFGQGGWPSLVRNLVVKDESGQALELKPAGAGGWDLAQPRRGRVELEYEVDYAPLAQREWPAPREAAYADADHFATIARALFIISPQVTRSLVRFALAPGWRPITPWSPSGSSGTEFAIRSAPELVENLVVLSRVPPEERTAGGFRLLVIPMGQWKQAGPAARRVLGSSVRQLVRLMDFRGRERYLVVLLPIREQGGESFRNSFASSAETVPTAESLPTWANTIAHEIFHYWNGWRLRGADYPSSQWFQEGFTEYAANLSLVAGGAIDEAQFRRKLTEHVRNYRKLSHALGAPVTRKGPPLYSGGALVAFCWDVRIREASEGRRGFGDFMRALWTATGSGERPWAGGDLRSALQRTAPGDWEAFFRSFIEGAEPLPLADTFAQVGLRLERALDGTETVERDPAAPAGARSRWRALITAR